MTKHEDGAALNGVALSDLLGAVLRVEHNYMTLRTPTGWLLWSQKVTSKADLNTVLNTAATNLTEVERLQGIGESSGIRDPRRIFKHELGRRYSHGITTKAPNGKLT